MVIHTTKQGKQCFEGYYVSKPLHHLTFTKHFNIQEKNPENIRHQETRIIGTSYLSFARHFSSFYANENLKISQEERHFITNRESTKVPFSCARENNGLAIGKKKKKRESLTLAHCTTCFTLHDLCFPFVWLFLFTSLHAFNQSRGPYIHTCL